MSNNDRPQVNTEIARMDINSKQLNDYVNMSLSCCTYDIAKVVHFCYKSKYVVAKLKAKQWYMFDGVKWRLTEIGPYYELSSEMVKIYESYRKREEAQYDGAFTDQEKEILDKKILAFDTIVQKLKNVNSKEQICKECLYLFYDPDFIYKLDKIDQLICFQNGVLNLDNNKFQIGDPEDYLSIMIECDFTYPRTSIEKKALTEIIESYQSFRLNILNKRKNKLIFTI